MEKQLKCFLMLSLEEIALRRMTVLLWSGSDILDSVSKFHLDKSSFEKKEAEWRDNFEDKIKDKVLELGLPESLREQMIERVRPIGLEIRKWVDSHGDYFFYSYHERYPPDLTKLCWTSAGTINNRKTAENLVRCNVLEIYQRYRLACSFCLENDIPLLFEKLPERIKGFYKHKVSEPLLHHCWPYILKGELSGLDYLLRTSDRNPFSFYQCAFEYSAKNGNKTAAEYFFLKLSHEEREDSLVRTARDVLTAIKNINPFELLEDFPKEKFSRIFFVLSLLNPEQQMEIFASGPVEVLFSFLDWPWQDLFSENLGLFWTLLPPISYGHLFMMMDYRYTKSEFYISKLFQELFVQSPLGFKKCLINEEPEFNYTFAREFLIQLFNSKDSETVGVIFRNLDAADRVKLFFDDAVLDQLFYCVLLGGVWQMVNVCLREATLSKEDRNRLRGAFMEFLKSHGTEDIDYEGQNSERFLKLLDDSEAVPGRGNKRKLEECCAE